MKPLYDASGSTSTHRQESDPEQVVPAVLAELDLDADLVEYAWTDEVDQAVRASTRTASTASVRTSARR